MTVLRTERLILRPWQERDREVFFEINSDPAVMRYFPFRRTRPESDAFFAELMKRQDQGTPTFQALELRETGDCLGFCGLHATDIEAVMAVGTVEIGWRLAARHWGNGYASEAAREWLRFGFEDLGLEEIVSFAVSANRRSTAVMERIGMRHDAVRDFDHPNISETLPDLRRHVFYCLTAGEWRRTKKGGQQG